jgi:hypothetical protein
VRQNVSGKTGQGKFEGFATMSLFGTIKDAIFESPEGETAITPEIVAAVSPPTQDSSASQVPTPDAETKAAKGSLPVDVAATLAALASNCGKSLNYQTSIVDLLRLLGLDSSRSRRKELADELGYPGSEHDTAAMDKWLHAEVMTTLAGDGGVVPDEWQH